MIIIIHAFLVSCTTSDRIPGYVYLRLNAEPSTLDPAFITDLSGGGIAAKLFNGLVRLDSRMALVPDIAERWEISGDGRIYTFHLRKGVFFSNGREVVAGDFKYSLERIMNSATVSPNGWIASPLEGAVEFREGRAGEISGIKVLGAHLLELRLQRPFSPFLGMLTTTAASVLPKEEVVRMGREFSLRPVGTGPFVVRSRQQNREIWLERNDIYFSEKPKVKGLVYKVIPEDLTAVTEFELGNLDLLAVPASAYGRFSKEGRWKGSLVPLQGLNTYYLGLNTSKPPFNDREVRLAVASAIDRTRILSSFFESRGIAAFGPVPPYLREWQLERDLPPYNPEKARKIIEARGLRGMRVLMYVTADQEVMDLAEIIQSYLRAAGISMEIRSLEWTSFRDAVNKGEPDLFWLSWWADYPDAENFLFPLFHSSNVGSAGNRTRYMSPFTDNCIERGRRAGKRYEKAYFYRKAEERVIDDLPLIPFWHKTDYLVHQPWIEGARSFPLYTMDKGTDLFFLADRPSR
ncbi:MAG: ABC transporter substrate-binding protein [Nitrospirales bacterium]|nr:ABC transporter substrate-binding protein [Nitrospirales bacterium]